MKRRYTEDVMRALEAITNRVSMRRASLDYRVPRSILQDRINSHTSYQETAIPFQKLAPVQEKRLTDWVLVQENLGLSPAYSQIKDFV
jgi:hypothetical protein